MIISLIYSNGRDSLAKQKIQVKTTELEKDFKLALDEIETWSDDEITERINIQLVHEEEQKEFLQQADDLYDATLQSEEIYNKAIQEYEADNTDAQKSKDMTDAENEWQKNKKVSDAARENTTIGAHVLEFEKVYYADLREFTVMIDETISLESKTPTEDTTKEISELKSKIEKLDLVNREQELKDLQEAEEKAMIQARDGWIEVTSNEVAKAKFNLDQDFWNTVNNLQLRKKETNDKAPAFSAKQVALIMYPLAFIEII